MNLFRGVVALSGMLLATTGCVEKSQTEISGVDLVKSLPVETTDIRGEQDARSGNLKLAEAGFVRVQFRTKADLRREAAARNTTAYIRPCGQRSGEEPDYVEHSSIFAADDGSYAAFFPARIDLLVRQDPHGGLELGWPEATLANGVCFQVSGLDMLHAGLRTDEVKLDRMAGLLKPR